MSNFKIIPVDEVEQKTTKERRAGQRATKKGGKVLNDSEVWEYGWLMWKMGSLFRFRIRGATDMNTPITPEVKYRVNKAPKARRVRFSFRDNMKYLIQRRTY
jgi:hypothetical protein